MKMIRIVLLLITLTLVACSSSKDANNSNFEKAVNAHFAKDCISIRPFVLAADGHSFPMTVKLEQKNSFISQATVDQNNAEISRPFDVLVQAGVLSESNSTSKESPMFGTGEITVPTKIYALTDLGKKAIISPESTAMCVGHYKVDEVVRFTQPNNALGQTISEVSLTVSPIDVPNWAKRHDVQKTFGLQNELADHIKMTRTVLLANDGWIDADDFGK